MPFRRKGLCRTDQVKCARMLKQGAHPKAIAKLLHTTVKVVKAHTSEAVEKANFRAKTIEKIAVKHAQDTRTTASALAGAAKEILSQGPGTVLGEKVETPVDPPLLKPAVDPAKTEGGEAESFE